MRKRLEILDADDGHGRIGRQRVMPEDLKMQNADSQLHGQISGDARWRGGGAQGAGEAVFS